MLFKLNNLKKAKNLKKYINNHFPSYFILYIRIYLYIKFIIINLFHIIHKFLIIHDNLLFIYI